MAEASVFVGADGRFVATEFARGPWDPQALHGGAPAALLMREFERVDSNEGLAIARVTYEFVRPVPLGELSLQASVSRPGRRVQLLEGVIRDSRGVEVVRARALRVRRASTSADSLAGGQTPPSGPAGGRPSDLPPSEMPMFGSHAMEIRFVAGEFYSVGPATAWFRMRVPLVAGENPSPLQRVAAAGDFGNGISSALSWEDHVFINPDLTLYVEREPVGEWICLEAATRIASGGVGIAESVLYDETGRVGRATQALFVARR